MALLPLLWLAACATPGPPSAQTRPAAKPSAGKPAPRWQAVPARADGAAVPGGRRHIVKRGETGIAIARAYRVPWSRIAAANRMGPDAMLEIGQALFIPQQAAAPRLDRPSRSGRPNRPPLPGATPEQQAAAFDLDIDDLVSGSAPARPARSPASPAAAQAATRIPPLAWPIDGRVILSRFGPKPGGRVNDGVNIKAVQGAPVRAAADGEILYVGDAIAGFGLMMLVRHPGGAVTAYGHLEDALGDRGDRVRRGQPIARAGSSGSADQPQLMFQVRQGRRPVDPLLYLPS